MVDDSIDTMGAKWEVKKYETLSGHKYIIFEIPFKHKAKGHKWVFGEISELRLRRQFQVGHVAPT